MCCFLLSLYHRHKQFPFGGRDTWKYKKKNVWVFCLAGQLQRTNPLKVSADQIRMAKCITCPGREGAFWGLWENLKIMWFSYLKYSTDIDEIFMRVILCVYVCVFVWQLMRSRAIIFSGCFVQCAHLAV